MRATGADAGGRRLPSVGAAVQVIPRPACAAPVSFATRTTYQTSHARRVHRLHVWDVVEVVNVDVFVSHNVYNPWPALDHIAELEIDPAGGAGMSSEGPRGERTHGR